MPERKTGSKQREKQRKPKADGSAVPKQEANPNLNAGGTPGNRGGGAPKNKIRELSINLHQRALVNLGNKLAGGKLTTSEELALVDKAGKYGVGIKTEISIENAHFAALVVEVALKHMPEENWDLFKAEVKGFLGDL